MIKYVNRLTMEQLSAFFYGIGSIYNIKKSFNKDMLDIYFVDSMGKRFWYSIADNYISAPGFYKTSVDWKFYMKKLFGEAYWKDYREEPVENTFISKLSLTDVKEWLERDNIKVEKIEECEAFRKGTRRFKLMYHTPVNMWHEVVIGPHLKYCEGLSEMTEKAFMKFFTKKFGMDFITYYSDAEKRECNQRIEMYRQKCEGKLNEKREYMISIWENS